MPSGVRTRSSGIIVDVKPAFIPSPFQGPGDIVSGATNFWGLMPYSAAYASSLGRSVNLTDSAAHTFDVLFNADGSLNTSVFSGKTAPYTLNKAYDQVGTVDFDNPFTNNPVFALTGGPNNKANITFGITGTDRSIFTTNSQTVAFPFTYVILAITDNGRAAEGGMFESASPTSIRFNSGGVNDNKWNVANGGGAQLITTATDSIWHLGQAVFPASGSASGSFQIDNGSPNVGQISTISPSGRWCWGATNAGTNFVNMSCVVVGVWPKDFSSPDSRTSIYNNIHGYWGW